MTLAGTPVAAARAAPATVAPTARAVRAVSGAPALSLRARRLGAWLPQFEDLFEPWRRHLASASAKLAFGDLNDVPARATWFAYGPTLVKVQAVYDPVRRLVLYDQGCCTWNETVYAYAPQPPESVIRADLSAVRTRHGIALGASPASVVGAYGPARMHTSTKSPGVRVLSYWRNQFVKGSGCAWFENFVFRANRLIEIQAGHGC